MHIPDGYLSPQTTIPAIAIMVPVWATALKKVKKTLMQKQIPLLALCAAFSFVIMMFNVPVGESKFIPLDEGIPSDHYLWLTGQAARMLKNKQKLPSTKPEGQ